MDLDKYSKATYKNNAVALKQMFSQLLEQTDLDDLAQECKFLATLGNVEHPGIVGFTVYALMRIIQHI